MNSSEVCGDLKRNSCVLSPAEFGEYDAIAGIRTILSCLSVLGTLSIIFLAIGKRQAFRSKVHPIFVLSLADFVLACLWIIGGYFWLRRIENRAWCLVVSLLSVIVQCITINLTLIYAILAHHALKKAKSGTTNAIMMRETDHLALEKVWKSSFTIGVYAIAWVAPVLIVIFTFGIVTGTSLEIVTRVNNCSCWCLPTYGNILPFAYAQDAPTASYIHSISKFIAAYGSVISFHYCVVFTLMVIIYHKILKCIQQIRHDNYYEKTHRTYNYGRISRSIIDSQSKARTRIALYVLVFLINGSINFLLSLGLVVFETYKLSRQGPMYVPADLDRATSLGRVTFIVLLILQSLTVPLQGFLNAIIYGWTRREFVNSMALVKQEDLGDETVNQTEGLIERDNSGSRGPNSAMLYSRILSDNNNVIDSFQGEILTDTEA